MIDWEGTWAAYDEDTYAAALALVPPGAVVLDIGAGDLRFARRLAARARLVYAVARRPGAVSYTHLPAHQTVLDTV